METLSLLPRPTQYIPKLERTVPTITYNNSLYGGRFRFEVPYYNDLNRQWIKAHISVARDNVSVPVIFEEFLAFLLLSNISLSSVNGPIQTLDPVTMIARLGLIYGTPLYYSIIGGKIDAISGAFDAVDGSGQTFYIPLFWFFSDVPGDCLSANRGPLWVDITTANSALDMGFSKGQLQSATYELYSNFAQINNNTPVVYKEIPLSYNSFHEDPVYTSIPATGAPVTTVRIPFKCPNEVFYVHFYAKKITDDELPGSGSIISVKLVSPLTTLFDRDVGTNCFNNGQSYDPGQDGAFSIKFGERNYDDGNYIKFSQSMSGTYALVTFSGASGMEYEISTVCEYRSKISVGVSGLFENISGLLEV